MKQIDVKEVQADFSQFLKMIEAGEMFYLFQDNCPIAEIRPKPPRRTTPRLFGQAAGMVDIHPSFFEPLPDDILALFNGERPPDEKP